jgi:hypothetical protein
VSGDFGLLVDYGTFDDLSAGQRAGSYLMARRTAPPG